MPHEAHDRKLQIIMRSIRILLVAIKDPDARTLPGLEKALHANVTTRYSTTTTSRSCAGIWRTSRPARRLRQPLRVYTRSSW